MLLALTSRPGVFVAKAAAGVVASMGFAALVALVDPTAVFIVTARAGSAPLDAGSDDEQHDDGHGDDSPRHRQCHRRGAAGPNVTHT